MSKLDTGVSDRLILDIFRKTTMYSVTFYWSQPSSTGGAQLSAVSVRRLEEARPQCEAGLAVDLSTVSEPLRPRPLRSVEQIMLKVHQLLMVAALFLGCAKSVTESTDPEENYRYKFSTTLQPKPQVVHSRVQRETSLFLGLFHVAESVRYWEFELIVARSWIEAVRQDGFEEIAWAEVEYRDDIPEWFTPNAKAFTAFRLPHWGSVPDAAAHLFIESAPRDPDQVRVFMRRY